MRLLRLLALLIMVAAAHAQAAAEPPPTSPPAAPPAGGEVEDLPDVEVTVQRLRQAKEDVAAPITVVRPSQSIAPTASSVAEVVGPVPGLDRRPVGSDAGVAGFFLRGAKAEQVLVLVDGRRVGTAQGAGVDLGDLPVAEVERVEVLRGGASALFGSDPIGGVINLVTRRGGDGRLRATLRGGSFGAIGGRLAAGDSRGRGTWRWNAEYYSQDGDFEYRTKRGETLRRANNRLLSRDLGASGGWDFGRGGRLSGGAEFHAAVRGVPGMVEFPSPTAWQKDERRGAWLAHEVDLGAGTRLRASANWLDNLRDYVDRDGFYPVDAHHDNRRLAAELLTTWAVAGSRQANLGLDWRRDQINSTADGRHHRITGGLFGQYEVGLGSVVLSPSARLDLQTGQTPIFTPRLGAVWRLSPSVSARGGYTRAFRAPSFDDLYWPADAYSEGNPNLRPERASEWNIGLVWQPWARSSLELDYFNRDARDLITWLPSSGSKWRPVNLGSVRFQGLEASWETPLPHLPKLVASATYAWLKATTHSGTEAEIGKQLVGRPFHQGSASLAWRAEHLGGGLTLTASGPRYTTAANTEKLPAYLTLDLHGHWRPSDRDVLTVELRNVTNTRYETVQGYPLPGLELRLALSRTL